MLNISLWATTPVATKNVLTAVLAPVISITLVHICKSTLEGKEQKKEIKNKLLKFGIWNILNRLKNFSY